MYFITDYVLFLAKSITFVLTVLALMAGMIAIAQKGKTKDKIKIKNLNTKFLELKLKLQEEIFNKKELKKAQKKLKKSEADHTRKRIYLLNFKGDVAASAVESLRKEVTAILQVARPQDEVLINLESPGGIVHNYGLAASQLERIRQKKLKLTACVDSVAASGGYMMACVANRILAAPFAIIGSIGVVAQLPNFHRFLKKHDIDFEQITAGEYKRTMTLFGENTDKDREKCKEQIEEIHTLFKSFVKDNRPQLDIEKVSTGEYWYGKTALELKLVDELRTSDDYLLDRIKDSDIYEVSCTEKKSLSQKFSEKFQSFIGM